MHDSGHFASAAHVGAEMNRHEPIQWKCSWKVEKFWGDDTSGTPYEVIEREGNMLMYGGVSVIWQALIGNGTTTAAQALTFFNAANAYLGVGDSTTVAVATHTDLQATPNKLRRGMDPTYPQHTDGVAVGAASITFRSTFAQADANWVWNEWALFNGATDGRMLNRKVEVLGTKSSAASWVLSVSLSLV